MADFVKKYGKHPFMQTHVMASDVVSLLRQEIDTRAVTRKAHLMWREMAVSVRSSARARGVQGQLRWLDEVASGHRGRAVPNAMCAMALEMRRAGVPLHTAKERLAAAVEIIVRIGYEDDAPPAA
jgi:hypothetical protein